MIAKLLREKRGMEVVGHGSLRNTGRVVAIVVPDDKWPDMFRARLVGGDISDMANLTRAKDAAVCLALAALNRQKPEAA